jgi:hypothetical protein
MANLNQSYYVHLRRFAMLEVTVATFRKRISDYLGNVRKGEDISLTDKVTSCQNALLKKIVYLIFDS